MTKRIGLSAFVVVLSIFVCYRECKAQSVKSSREDGVCDLNTERSVKLHFNGSSGEVEELQVRTNMTKTSLEIDTIGMQMMEAYSSTFTFDTDFKDLKIEKEPQIFYHILHDALSSNKHVKENMPYHQIKFANCDKIELLEDYREMFRWDENFQNIVPNSKGIAIPGSPTVRHKPDVGDTLLLYVIFPTKYEHEWWLLPLHPAEFKETMKIRELATKLNLVMHEKQLSDTSLKLEIQRLELENLRLSGEIFEMRRKRFEQFGDTKTLEGHTGSVRDVAISPCGKWAVSASWDSTLKVWGDRGAEIGRSSGVAGWSWMSWIHDSSHPVAVILRLIMFECVMIDMQFIVCVCVGFGLCFIFGLCLKMNTELDQKKKGHLILDIDNTLGCLIKDAKRKKDEDTVRFKTNKDEWHTFKFRPGIFHFLRSLVPLYEISICTQATQE